MPYCPNCGVEVDDETERCPLCDTPVPSVGSTLKADDEYPRYEHDLKYTRRPFTLKERHVMLWLVSLVLLIPFMIVLVVDIFLNSAVTWSVFPIIGLGGIWLFTAIALFQRSFWRLFLSFFILIVLLSLLISFIAGAMPTFFKWNLPVIVAVVVPALVCAIYSRKTRNRGSNIAGSILWGIAAFCIALDGIIGLNTGREAFLHGWSLIVASALLPLGALMMYLHYRFGQTFSLKRYFHV